MIYIITLYNKPDYFILAAASVKAQTRECVHLAKQDIPDTGGLYPPAVYFNKTVKDKDMFVDDYIAWLSDDDILLPNYVADLAGYLDTHPGMFAVYGMSEHKMFDINTGFSKHIRMLPQDTSYPVYTASLSPWCKLDGGQFMIRRSVLDHIPYPWYPESADNSSCQTCDGRIAEKIASVGGIHPLQPMKLVMENRATPKSSHSVLVNGALRLEDWKIQRSL